MNNKEKSILKICSRCVMDSSVHDIHFDDNGHCNYCNELINLNNTRDTNNIHNDLSLENLLLKIKASANKGKYDCIVGVSGGVDSSFVLLKTKEYGLKPLAVHMDNGWNSELAQNNISNLVNKLGIDLYTHVINWEEYKGMMQAFFDADVVDIELLYDNAMLAVNYNLAKKYNVKYILGGTNSSTEGMRLPADWNWFKYDKKNIQSIVKLYSNTRIKTFPLIGIRDYFFNEFILKIRWVSILDLIDYKKDDALKVLVSDFNYKPYPYKHYESIFTRFYQGYILPTKFKIDKRKNHLSTLIVNGQISREEALLDLKRIPYPSEEALDVDKEYFLKKMGWSDQTLREYLLRGRNEHNNYGSYFWLWKFLKKINIYLSNKFNFIPLIKPNR